MSTLWTFFHSFLTSMSSHLFDLFNLHFLSFLILFFLDYCFLLISFPLQLLGDSVSLHSFGLQVLEFMCFGAWRSFFMYQVSHDLFLVDSWALLGTQRELIWQTSWCIKLPLFPFCRAACGKSSEDLKTAWTVFSNRRLMQDKRR